MKQFKNKFAVKGDKFLLQAMKEALIEIGHKWDEKYPYKSDITHIIVNGFGGDSECGYNQSAGYSKEYTLPQDWEEVIALASEVINPIPRYVKLLPNFDSNHTGEIFDTSEPLPKYKLWDWKSWDKVFINYSHSFQEVSLEEYETFLLEKEIKQYGLEIGDFVNIIDEDDSKGWYKGGEFESLLSWTKHQKILEFKLIGKSLYLKLNGNSSGWVKASCTEKVKKFKTLAFGDIKVIIYKGKIECQGNIIPIEYLQELLETMNNTRIGRFDWSEVCDWEITFPQVKIGCTTFSIDDIKLIINTYKQWN